MEFKMKNRFLKRLTEKTDNQYSRKQILDYMAAGGLGLMASSLLSCREEERKADNRVKIGYLPITDATPLLVAHGRGFFEDEGLEAADPVLIRGWSQLIEAFVSGKVNVVHLLKPIPVWMRYNNDIRVKIMAWAHTNGSALVVGKNTGIEDFKGLGGTQIAVPFWYSMHNIVLQYGLRKSGLKPVIKPASAELSDDEVNLQILPPPEMPAALASGKIDGYIVAEPFNALGEVKVGAKVLRFTGDIWKNHPCCVVTMMEDDINERPEFTQKVMNAIVRAEIYSSNNKSEVAQLLSKDGKGYLPVPGKVVKKAMTDYSEADYAQPDAIRHADKWQNGRIDFQPWPYPSATKLIVEAMNDTVVSGDTSFLKNLSPDFVSDDLVDYNFVKKAIEKYPEWKNDPSVNPSDPFKRKEILRL